MFLQTTGSAASHCQELLRIVAFREQKVKPWALKFALQNKERGSFSIVCMKGKNGQVRVETGRRASLARKAGHERRIISLTIPIRDVKLLMKLTKNLLNTSAQQEMQLLSEVAIE